MECKDVAPLLLESARGRLAPAQEAAVREHLSSCERCTKQLERERQLDGALKLLPRPALPSRLAADLGVEPRRPRRPSWQGATALFAAAAACLALFLLARNNPGSDSPTQSRVVEEAVGDHLRQLYREHPLEVASSDEHTVKPWFAGRVDFAPLVRFEGDPDFPLVGGSVAYFIDRKAAVFAYTRRLHSISLLVMRADGLPWPQAPEARQLRGFNVLTWREGDLGYVLVSDLNEGELQQLGRKLRAE